MALKKLFDVTVNPITHAGGRGAAVMVLADTAHQARSLVEEAGRFGPIEAVLPQSGLVAAVGPNRIIGQFSQNVP